LPQRNGRDCGIQPLEVNDLCTQSILRRVHKKLRKNSNWSSEQLQEAIKDIDDGVLLETDAREYGISITTFKGHIYGKTLSRKRGKKGVLNDEEEGRIVKYLTDMQECGFPLHMGQLCAKVHEFTQSRITPFKDGIPERGWVRSFLDRHLELFLRKAQPLEQNRARTLCPDNIKSFYENLTQLYEKNTYRPQKIWKCNEFGAQAGKDKGGYVLAKRGSRNFHMIVSEQREWLSVLACINAHGQKLSNFFIFIGKKKSLMTFLKRVIKMIQ